jgi:hypothetical protein
MPGARVVRPPSRPPARRRRHARVTGLEVRPGDDAPYFSGGVTPAGRGTCATFSVIDTRL